MLDMQGAPGLQLQASQSLEERHILNHRRTPQVVCPSQQKPRAHFFSIVSLLKTTGKGERARCLPRSCAVYPAEIGYYCSATLQYRTPWEPNTPTTVVDWNGTQPHSHPDEACPGFVQPFSLPGAENGRISKCMHTVLCTGDCWFTNGSYTFLCFRI